MKKRLCAWVLTLVMLLPMGIAAQAAGYFYSVTVKGSNVYFVSGGQTLGSYAAKSTDIMLTTADTGELLVCFYSADGRYIGVDLGSQNSVTMNGSMSSLIVDRDLGKGVQVILGAGGSADSMQVNSPGNTFVQGKVGSLTASEAGQLTISKGASVNSVNADRQTRLYIDSGASVGNRTSNTASGSSSSRLTFKTSTIYAYYDDRLSDLRSELSRNVTAYAGGRKISGRASWSSSESTRVRRNGTYRFVFTPTSSSYPTTTGSIRVNVDDDWYDDHDDDRYDRYYDDYDIEIDTITVSDDESRLRDLTRDLRDNVRVYDEDGDKVSGRLEWAESSSTRVRETDDYKFRFIPNNSRYKSITDYITIEVD